MPRRCVAAGCISIVPPLGKAIAFTSFRETTARVQNGHRPLNAFEVTGMDLR